MSRINRVLCKWLSLVLVAIALTACGNNSDREITTITLSGWQSSPTEKQQLEQVLHSFEAEHPHIKIKYEVITDQYMDVIRTRLIGDAAPDVFFLDAVEAPLLMSHGVLEPLDDYISQDFDLADFKPNMLEAFKYEGRMYGLPKDFSTLALFYNKKSFQQVDIKQPPETWEALRQYSEKLTVGRDRNRRIDQYGLGISPELARQYFTIKAYGGKLVDESGYATFATPQSLKGLELVVDQYRIEKSSALPSDLGTSSGSEMFGQGRVSMVIEGSWAIPYLQETFPKIEFATAEVPAIDNNKGTMAYTVAYVMNEKSSHKQAAWELISYLTGKEGMKAWAKGGLVLPTRQSVLSELGYDRNPLYSSFIAGADYATLWQAGENLPTINTHFNNQFISALLGEQTLASAMFQAQTTANREINAIHY